MYTYYKKLSVNFHLWQPCNYKCGFCFAGFHDVRRSVLPTGHLTKGKAEDVVRHLAEYGFEKITFAGGEPTLCPWLGELISLAKNLGMVTMLVTNGSRLNEEVFNSFRPALDWVVLSIDSLLPETNRIGGRFQNKRCLPDAVYYLELINIIRAKGFKFKINTVVHRYNKNELLVDFVSQASPLRWKVFKVLGVTDQNYTSFKDFEISDDDFSIFLERNTNSVTKALLVPEDNDAMSGSYLMVDPAGRFFDNASGKHTYSEPIAAVGVERALEQTSFDYRKYKKRGAIYGW